MVATKPIERKSIELLVNGNRYKVEVEARTTLWEVLSERLRLTGTVRSCNSATCGVCTVLIDGVPLYSCNLLAISAEGKAILTIESLSKDGELDELQEAAYLTHAAQCGYCTSGWMMAAKALLARNPTPKADEVTDALSGHLCRCGCYSAIKRAVGMVAESAAKGVRPEEPEIGPSHSIIFRQPAVRDYSTGGGHADGDTIVEGDRQVVTRKWQGHPPENLNIIGRSVHPLKEVAIPKVTGKAEYSTRVVLPNMLYVKILGCPHPHARIKRIDTSKADGAPGVRFILTHRNAPPTNPLRQELMFQGEIVAVVAAETEDQAEDAVEKIQVDYQELPSVATVEQAMSPDAPKLRPEGNLILLKRDNPAYSPDYSIGWRHGDLAEGLRDAEVVKDFEYLYRGATMIPMQPVTGVARWEGDHLTYWGMSQSISLERSTLAKWLGIDEGKIRYVDRWNGGTFGASMNLRPLDGLVAYISKSTGRAVKYTLMPHEELSQLALKPEILSRFRVGATKEGKIVAMRYTTHQIVGDADEVPFKGGPLNDSARDQLVAYGTKIPNWEYLTYCYKTNTPPVGAARSNTQEELKFAFESMMDEMAEALGIDPVQFRLINAAKPGDVMSPASDWGREFGEKPEVERASLRFDSYATTEVLQEGAKAFGWKDGAQKPGGDEDRFVNGIGMAFVDHHAGQMGWHEGEAGFEVARGDEFASSLELDSTGNLTLTNMISESGTEHDTGVAQLAAELLGYRSLERVVLRWGDSDLGLPTAPWYGGRTSTLQGGAALVAAEKLRSRLLGLASEALHVSALELRLKDGAVFVADDPTRAITFAELAKRAGGRIGEVGHSRTGPGKGRALVRTVGACFVEVKVDVMTGSWRVTRMLFATDAGKVINPLTLEGDQDGAFLQGFNAVTDMIPWDVEAPGHALARCGFLDYRMPTLRELPDKMTHVFVESLEPRWYFGYKSCGETSIGAVPAAIANALSNAVGIRIREHPITPEKVLMAIRKKSLEG